MPTPQEYFAQDVQRALKWHREQVAAAEGEYRAWRKKRRLDPTIKQRLMFGRWKAMLMDRDDMPGIGIHGDGSEG